MSRFLDLFAQRAAELPDKVAFLNSDGESLAYGRLARESDALAAHLLAADPDRRPVALYGHKSPLMLVGLFACMKSGRAYVPVDTVFPQGRLADILDQLGGPLLLNTTDDPLEVAAPHAGRVMGRDDMARLAAGGAAPAPGCAIAGDDLMYIMFTSGSTGAPKGVMMHAGAIDAFCDHFMDLLESRRDDVYFNRVPLSFDMSLFDITAGLATGGTLFALEAAAEAGLKATFAALAGCGATQWTSTPSFVEACLADPSFGPGLLPHLHTMTLAGEVLRNATAARILQAFPGIRLINAYGPTEAESVSEVDVTPQLVERCNPLPVGHLAPGMRAIVRDPRTMQELPAGAQGEIFLAGATVAKGYYGRPDLTERAFSTYEAPDGRLLPCYRTGDVGYVDGDGLLYCLGRYDSQVKIGGFRIEVGEVEERLAALPDVAAACVVPVSREGATTHLCAFVQLADPQADTSYARTRDLKRQLKAVLPDYMVPRAFRYEAQLPVNANGKVDRKRLAARAAQPGGTGR